MKKYIFGRILRSLLSIFLVTTLVYAIVYTMIPKNYIFKQDPNYSKNTATHDSKIDYESTILQRMGYIEYWNSKTLLNEAKEADDSITGTISKENTKKYQDFLDAKGGDWELGEFDEGGYYAIRNIPIYERVWNFYANLFVIDHPWKIQDSSNPDLERYIRLENDDSVGWALVGSGTEHRYLLYFNGIFPFVHQNFITLNLGTSYPTYKDQEVLDVISNGQGATDVREQTFPTGVEKRSSVNVYTRTYRSPDEADRLSIEKFGEGDAYTKTESYHQDPSMIVSSSIIGLIGLVIAYVLGIPLAMLMARYKNRLFDNVSTVALTFLMALPSIALIYIIRFIGSNVFGLPTVFTQYGALDWRSYVLPALSLGILSLSSVAVWVRRYLIDQQSSDYVRFARAKGLSESEVSRKHIFKNAMVPIVSGIPGAIIGVIGGATLTESIFAFPGMGKILIDSVKASNNAMIIGIVFIFTVISVISMLLGDICMMLMDPRITFTSGRGRK